MVLRLLLVIVNEVVNDVRMTMDMVPVPDPALLKAMVGAPSEYPPLQEPREARGAAQARRA